MRSARYQSDGDESSGQDSFLDIVANIVGILILLVMVVGVRAARRPATSDANSQPPETAVSEPAVPSAKATAETSVQVEATLDVEAEIREAEGNALLVEKETKELVVNALQAKREIAEQDSLRVHLAAFVQQTEQQLAEKRDELEGDQRVDYDNRIAIADAQRRLDELARQQAAQLAEEAPVETLENLPTPLAKAVNDREFYLVLSQGRVAVLPLDALRDQLRARLDATSISFRGRDSVSFLVGPVGGFRLRFVLQRVHAVSQYGTRVGTRQRWEVVPSSDLIAEPIDQAIEEGSALMTSLAAFSPRDTTITVITYADSFDEFRTLKKRLYNLGYPVAGRPLPVGEPIIGSPQGTRSAAQ